MKTNVTLLVDKGIYKRFKKYCKHEGYYISRLFERFMEEKLDCESE